MLILCIENKRAKLQEQQGRHYLHLSDTMREATIIYNVREVGSVMVWYGDYLFNIIVHYLHSTSL